MTHPASTVATVDEILYYANSLDSGALLAGPASRQSPSQNARHVPRLGRTLEQRRNAAGNPA